MALKLRSLGPKVCRSYDLTSSNYSCLGVFEWSLSYESTNYKGTQLSCCGTEINDLELVTFPNFVSRVEFGHKGMFKIGDVHSTGSENIKKN